MTTSLQSLRATTLLLKDLEETQASQVAELRAAGTSWSDIAGALGITRQGATKRFGPRRRDIEDLPLSDPLFDPLFSSKQE